MIYPGLIDLHNHVAYNLISLWSPVNHPGPYDTRYQWTGNKGYDPVFGRRWHPLVLRLADRRENSIAVVGMQKPLEQVRL